MLIPSRHNGIDSVWFSQVDNSASKNFACNSCGDVKNKLVKYILDIEIILTSSEILSIICWVMVGIPYKLCSCTKQAVRELIKVKRGFTLR